LWIKKKKNGGAEGRAEYKRLQGSETMKEQRGRLSIDPKAHQHKRMRRKSVTEASPLAEEGSC